MCVCTKRALCQAPRSGLWRTTIKKAKIHTDLLLLHSGLITVAKSLAGYQIGDSALDEVDHAVAACEDALDDVPLHEGLVEGLELLVGRVGAWGGGGQDEADVEGGGGGEEDGVVEAGEHAGDEGAAEGDGDVVGFGGREGEGVGARRGAAEDVVG